MSRSERGALARVRLTAFQRACWPCWSGTVGAPAAALEHLCCWMHHTTFTHLHMSVWMWSQHVCLLDMSLLPNSLWLAGLWGGGERAAGSSESFLAFICASNCSGADLAGRTGCCRWLWQVLLAISGKHCSVSTLVWRSQKKIRHEKMWPNTHCFPHGQLALKEQSIGGPPTMQLNSDSSLLDCCRLYDGVWESIYM